jgi:hypothetical protein
MRCRNKAVNYLQHTEVYDRSVLRKSSHACRKFIKASMNSYHSSGTPRMICSNLYFRFWWWLSYSLQQKIKLLKASYGTEFFIYRYWTHIRQHPERIKIFLYNLIYVITLNSKINASLTSFTGFLKSFTLRQIIVIRGHYKWLYHRRWLYAML